MAAGGVTTGRTGVVAAVGIAARVRGVTVDADDDGVDEGADGDDGAVARPSAVEFISAAKSPVADGSAAPPNEVAAPVFPTVREVIDGAIGSTLGKLFLLNLETRLCRGRNRKKEASSRSDAAGIAAAAARRRKSAVGVMRGRLTSGDPALSEDVQRNRDPAGSAERGRSCRCRVPCRARLGYSRATP
jgi:hypothetical protein